MSDRKWIELEELRRPGTRRIIDAHKGLSETGFAVNRSVAIEYRWTAGHYDQLSQLASFARAHFL